MAQQVAIIAPYPSLKNEAQAVGKELGVDIFLAEGDLGAGVEAAQRAVAAGAEVVISRGGTALLIARSIDIPVVGIQVSPYDILRCLLTLRHYKKPVGIIGFRNVVYGAEDVGKALGLKIKQIIIESEEDAPGKIVHGVGEGIRMVIGDAVSIKHAQKLGIERRLIMSGREAIVRAIEEARRIAEVRIRERERAALMRLVVDNSTDGIVAIGQSGRITLFNPVAEGIFGIPAIEAIGANLEDKISGTQLPRVLRSGIAEYEELQQVGNKMVVAKYLSVTVNNLSIGAVANFRDVTEVQRLEQIVRQKLYAKGLIAKSRIEDLIGKSPVMRQLKEKAIKFSAVDADILVMGETGSGKEMLVQAVHLLSSRAQGPFVAVNCAALPESLLESELFGYEEGAFTGARKGGKPGLFEIAHGGTILLDELGEMPVKLQARLLRVLQEREVLRVGGHSMIPIDVRVIAATNRNLKARIREGEFREDLYYRLAILTLTVPALRERKEDISLLVEFFLHKHRKLNRQVKTIDAEAVKLFEEYSWPGNVRELEHALQRLIILNDGPVIGVSGTSDMLQELRAGQESDGGQASLHRQDNLAEAEMHIISSVLAEENFNRAKAAERLGIDRSTLWRKLRNVAKNNKDVL